MRPYYDSDEEDYHFVKGPSSTDERHQNSAGRETTYRDERSGLLYESPGGGRHDFNDDSDDDVDDDDDDSGEEIILNTLRNNHRL